MKVKVHFAQPTTLAKTEKWLKEVAAAENEELRRNLEAAYAFQEQFFQERVDAERKLECARRDLEHLQHRFSDACADRDNHIAAYKQLQASFTEYQGRVAADADKHEEEVSDLLERLNDRIARINELEKRNKWLVAEVGSLREAYAGAKDELAAVREDADINRHVAEQFRIKYELEAAAREEEKDAFERAVNDFDENRKEYEKEIARLQKEKNSWIAEYEETKNELAAAYDEISVLKEVVASQQRTIEDAGETISNLRQSVNANPNMTAAVRHFFNLLKDSHYEH